LLAYGKTGRTFHTSYKEHIQVRSNKGNSGYPNHILNTGHTYGIITDNGHYKNREKRKIFEHIRKMPYI
jgi:hypothetical protein